ncbi:hypothetical protein P167DRAFT_541262 [Morchella conica CCBAS932]|uniref:Uncharacterized protein n=1 Tax=Morchella conica CCBAS932 TaxID=1392247 RepID=A0A3N4L2U3_9PEZI|nr:hypothetical protein P167DRAFT_541262 [Morchella conica CCBAS932]
MPCVMDAFRGYANNLKDSTWESLMTHTPVVAHFILVIITTPWEFLKRPVVHILRIDHTEDQRNIMIELWCKNKRSEYRYVAMSGTVVASAVTASLSWESIRDKTTWFTRGAWYGSIVLGLLSVTISFHLILLFAHLDVKGPQAIQKVLSRGNIDSGRADWAFLYVLQVPGMLLGFSSVSYFLGLTFLVTSPLWDQEWGTETKESDTTGCTYSTKKGITGSTRFFGTVLALYGQRIVPEIGPGNTGKGAGIERANTGRVMTVRPLRVLALEFKDQLYVGTYVQGFYMYLRLYCLKSSSSFFDDTFY